METKKFCKKHGSGMLEYGDFNNNQVMLCPLCHRIENAKADLGATIACGKRQITEKKQEWIRAKNEAKSEIEYAKERTKSIKLLDANKIYLEEVNNRAEFKKRHLLEVKP